MDINSAFPGDFLKAADLQNKAVGVIIDRVEMKDVGGDHKPVVFFQGKDRGLVLNKTNANTIADMYSSETGNWTGAEITLYPAEVEFQGRMVMAIRVRAPNNQTVAAWRAAQRDVAQQQPQQMAPAQSDPLDSDVPF